MMGMSPYFCVLVDTPALSPNSSSSACFARFNFFGFGMGVMNAARRRFAAMTFVGWPDGSSSQCLAGYS